MENIVKSNARLSIMAFFPILANFMSMIQQNAQPFFYVSNTPFHKCYLKFLEVYSQSRYNK